MSEPTPGDVDLVTVATFTTPMEAELAKSRLEAAGIEAFVLHGSTVGVLPFLANVELQVAPANADAAREILAS